MLVFLAFWLEVFKVYNVLIDLFWQNLVLKR